MASTVQTIDVITYIVAVYICCFILICGLIGNILIILVFTQLKIFRKNQSVFYLIVTSIFNSYQVILVTAFRTSAVAFNFDPTRTSLIWCKLRAYIISFTAITSVGIICLAAIDQYLFTSYYVRVRQLSTYKLAQRAISVLIVVALLYSIPFPLYHDIRPNVGCGTFDAAFNYFYSFVHFCILTGIIPILISSLFSFLAYQNVRRLVRRQMAIVRRRLDRQLTAMILLRVILFVVSTVPFICYRIYRINYPVNQNDQIDLSVDRLINTTVTAIFTINHSGAFYLFWATSTRFRRQVKYFFQKKLCHPCMLIKLKTNRVTPQAFNGSNSSNTENDS